MIPDKVEVFPQVVVAVGAVEVVAFCCCAKAIPIPVAETDSTAIARRVLANHRQFCHYITNGHNKAIMTSI